jgi:type II secretory pathway component PulF
MPMKPADVRHALFFLGNLLHSGSIPAAEALAEMAKIQPKHTAFWEQATACAQQGFPLSHCLEPILPPSILSAFRAAETSGSINEVLALVEQSYITQETVMGALKSLIKPAAMILVGLGTFLFFSVIVVPSLTKTLPSTGHDPLVQFTTLLNGLFVRYGDLAGIALMIAVVGATLWLRDPLNRQTIIGTAGSIPMLGPALTNLHFGLWAYHMAISTKAGLVVTDALRLSKTILPLYLQPAVQAIADDAVQYGLIGASDPTQRPATDARHKLPTFVLTAFRLSERTGETDKAFLSAGDSLVKQSVRQVLMFSKTASNIILPIAGLLIGSSILPYFTQLGSAMDHLH